MGCSWDSTAPFTLVYCRVTRCDVFRLKFRGGSLSMARRIIFVSLVFFFNILSFTDFGSNFKEECLAVFGVCGAVDFPSSPLVHH